jgi:hypothetical protein
MGPRITRAIALHLWALTALGPVNPVRVVADAAALVAAPLSPEETVYRPECPAPDLSNGAISCRGAGADRAGTGR